MFLLANAGHSPLRTAGHLPLKGGDYAARMTAPERTPLRAGNRAGRPLASCIARKMVGGPDGGLSSKALQP